ncbi:MAG TPA: COR domain-containing protein [Bryobacteraceae bacterium]|nr:COR domain-containing protein [Bryobacteraceae bacterium]
MKIEDHAGYEEAIRRIQVAQRSSAEHLDLSSINLGALPGLLGQLTTLQSLELRDNQLRALPESMGQLTNLRRLNLSHNRLIDLPESMGQLTNLQNLDLNYNRLIDLPGSVGQLINLQRLDLSYNHLSALPESIGQLADLQTLDLSSNLLSALPESIGQLANLQTLDLSSNLVSVLPESLGQLKNLRTLILIGNQLTALSESLGQLTNLQKLYLSYNQLTALSEPIGQLTNLRTLDLSFNQVSTLPESLGHLTALTELFLHGNPNLGIPEEVLGSRLEEEVRKAGRAPREILEYYFAQRLGSKPLNEGKLILVGRGGVGKTSLVKMLTTSKFKKGEKTTEGIKISEWTCPLSRTQTVTMHVWDFGGQEMMHATHQFFLTARTLYLLVLDRRLGGYDAEADYWFRLIRAFGGPDAPVIVVLNKQKEEPFDVNRGGWLEKYAGNIAAFVTTDCADSKSITVLKRTIQERLGALKSIQEKFPSRWFAIKEELSRMTTDYVSFSDYRQICTKHGEADPERQSSLSGFLHDLGIALNYKDDPRLRFSYVLKPEWVTEGIYALIHAFINSKGVFTPGEAEVLLREKKYTADEVQFLLGLMERFELSFPFGDSKTQILIPQLLEDQQPSITSEFNLSECLNFGYRYTIVPEGLLPRFIVRTRHLHEQATRWKSGVVLRHSSGCRALVRADTAERQVRIHIDGPTASRRDLLAIIRHNFDAIHADYEFNPEDLLYPPGEPAKPLPLDDLRALRREGEATVPVVLADKKVIRADINSLIKSVEYSKPKLRLFLSYSHQDEKHANELRKDLILMERNGLIHTWFDRELSAGDKWESNILNELKSADIIVCQLSRDFLASDFCVLTELDIAIQRKIDGQAELIAYILKDCGWQDIPRLKQFQVLPRDAMPLANWRNKDKYWRAVAEGIQKVVEKLHARRV